MFRTETIFPRRLLITAALLGGMLPALSHAADKLRVGMPSNGFVFSPVALGTEAGIFGRHGLAVEQQLYSGGAKLSQGVLGGNTDISITGATDFVFSVKGIPETTVGAVTNRALNMGIAVANDIKTVADLRGRKIGVTSTGTLTYWLALELARTSGWGEQGIQPVSVGGPTAGQIAALTTGQVSAVISDSSVGIEIEEAHRGRLLITGDDYVKNFLTISILSSHALIHEHPEVLRRFLAAWYETIAFMLDNKAEAVRVGAVFSGAPQSVIGASYDLERPGWSLDGRISQAQLDQMATALVQGGMVDARPDLAKYYTDAFLPPAKGSPAIR